MVKTTEVVQKSFRNSWDLIQSHTQNKICAQRLTKLHETSFQEEMFSVDIEFGLKMCPSQFLQNESLGSHTNKGKSLVSKDFVSRISFLLVWSRWLIFQRRITLSGGHTWHEEFQGRGPKNVARLSVYICDLNIKICCSKHVLWYL